MHQEAIVGIEAEERGRMLFFFFKVIKFVLVPGREQMLGGPECQSEGGVQADVVAQIGDKGGLK